jgi:hypothetical protein
MPRRPARELTREKPTETQKKQGREIPRRKMTEGKLPPSDVLRRASMSSDNAENSSISAIADKKAIEGKKAEIKARIDEIKASFDNGDKKGKKKTEEQIESKLVSDYRKSRKDMNAIVTSINDKYNAAGNSEEKLGKIYTTLLNETKKSHDLSMKTNDSNVMKREINTSYEFFQKGQEKRSESYRQYFKNTWTQFRSEYEEKGSSAEKSRKGVEENISTLREKIRTAEDKINDSWTHYSQEVEKRFKQLEMMDVVDESDLVSIRKQFNYLTTKILPKMSDIRQDKVRLEQGIMEVKNYVSSKLPTYIEVLQLEIGADKITEWLTPESKIEQLNNLQNDPQKFDRTARNAKPTAKRLLEENVTKQTDSRMSKAWVDISKQPSYYYAVSRNSLNVVERYKASLTKVEEAIEASSTKDQIQTAITAHKEAWDKSFRTGADYSALAVYSLPNPVTFLTRHANNLDLAAGNDYDFGTKHNKLLEEISFIKERYALSRTLLTKRMTECESQLRSEIERTATTRDGLSLSDYASEASVRNKKMTENNIRGLLPLVAERQALVDTYAMLIKHYTETHAKFMRDLDAVMTRARSKRVEDYGLKQQELSTLRVLNAELENNTTPPQSGMSPERQELQQGIAQTLMENAPLAAFSPLQRRLERLAERPFARLLRERREAILDLGSAVKSYNQVQQVELQANALSVDQQGVWQASQNPNTLHWDDLGRAKVDGHTLRVYQLPISYENNPADKNHPIPVLHLPIKALNNPHGASLKFYGAGLPALPGGSVEIKDAIANLKSGGQSSLYATTLQREMHEEMPGYQSVGAQSMKFSHEVKNGVSQMLFFRTVVEAGQAVSASERIQPAEREMSKNVLQLNLLEFSQQMAKTPYSIDGIIKMIAHKAHEKGFVTTLPHENAWGEYSGVGKPQYRDYLSSSSMDAVAKYIEEYHLERLSRLPR